MLAFVFKMLAFVFNADSYIVVNNNNNVDSYAGFLGILSLRGTIRLICSRMIGEFKCNKENECHKTKTHIMILVSHKGHREYGNKLMYKQVIIRFGVTCD